MEEKRKALVGYRLAEDIRYNERSGAERVNANLKDNHGGRTVQVRGPAKVMCHLMFGVTSVRLTKGATLGNDRIAEVSERKWSVST
jgi:hypothetical protein